MKLQRITWYTLGSYCVTHECNHYSSFFCHSSSVPKKRMNLSVKQEKTRKVTTSSHLFRADTKRDEEMIEEADVREWIGNCSWVSIDYLRFLASSSPIRFVFLSFCFRSFSSSLFLILSMSPPSFLYLNHYICFFSHKHSFPKDSEREVRRDK